MSTPQRPVTDREVKAWLAAGATVRSVGDGLTISASAAAALEGKATWILRYRLNGKPREKVLGRYPQLSLKEARQQAHQDRIQIERGVDVSAAKQAEKAVDLEVPTVERLGDAWLARYIQPRYKHPDVVARVLRKHIHPAIGQMAPKDVKPAHIDWVLKRIVAAGAPTVANDALRYMQRMFRMGMRYQWVDRNPAADFDEIDAGGDETPRDRWLSLDELKALAVTMRTTPNFGRENELAVWLLLALCVRKMELLSARWEDFDLEAGVWTLTAERNKTGSAIRIPLTPPVLAWLGEARIFSCGKPHVFPARRLVHTRLGQARKNRYEHISPDTLNVALKRLQLPDIEHFTVHDMRRTARTHLAEMGVDRFVAERSLNHKLRSVEGIYNRHDYFAERQAALGAWAALLAKVQRDALDQVVMPPKRAAAPTVRHGAQVQAARSPGQRDHAQTTRRGAAQPTGGKGLGARR